MTVRVTRSVAALLTMVVAISIAAGVATPANAVTAYTTPREVMGAPVIPEESVEFQGQLFFSGSSLAESPPGMLYSFDGTTFRQISAMYSGVTNLRVINDVLYFSAKSVGVWFVVAYDGTTLTPTAIQSSYTSIEFIGYDTDILAIVQTSPGSYELQYFVDGSVRLLETYAYAHGLTDFAGLAYFVATPVGGSGYEMNRTDGVLVQSDVTDPGSNMFVWKNALYMANIDQTWAFTKVLPDLTTTLGATPTIEYAVRYLDAGDVLYFTGYRADVQSVFSYDGETATALPSGLEVVGDLVLFDGQLFATSISSNVTVCGAEVAVTCADDSSDVFYFDGTQWVNVAAARSSLGELIAFQSRLYFQDGAKWMFIERATLANTGLDVTAGVGASAVLLVLGVGAVLWRRRIDASRTD